MLSAKDIKRLILAMREVFATKEELFEVRDELTNKFSVLQTTVDNFATKVTRHDNEIIVINHRLDKLENKKRD